MDLTEAVVAAGANFASWKTFQTTRPDVHGI
jgi:hypothetical protein